MSKSNNAVILIGRLTKDPEVRYGGENKTCVVSFTLAVDRKGKDKEADFIRVKAFGKTAEVVEKYVKKGTKIAVDGRIQTGSYKDKNGATVYTTDVVVDDLEFCEKKSATSEASEQSEGGFVAMPDKMEEELPFNF